MINGRSKSTSSDEKITKVTNFFGLEPEYFFKYGIRKMIEFIEENREYLDHCEKELHKWQKKNLNKKKKKTPPLPLNRLNKIINFFNYYNK